MDTYVWNCLSSHPLELRHIYYFRWDLHRRRILPARDSGCCPRTLSIWVWIQGESPALRRQAWGQWQCRESVRYVYYRLLCQTKPNKKRDTISWYFVRIGHHSPSSCTFFLRCAWISLNSSKCNSCFSFINSFCFSAISFVDLFTIFLFSSIFSFNWLGVSGRLLFISRK